MQPVARWCTKLALPAPPMRPRGAQRQLQGSSVEASMGVLLSQKFVQGLRAEGRRLEVRDAKVAGLVLRVTPAGKKTWSFQFRQKGCPRTRRQTLGPYPAITIASAREKAIASIRTLHAGGDPIAEKKARQKREARARLTFTDLFEEYIDRRRAIVSMREIEREMRKDALPALGKKMPCEITAAEIDELVQLLLRRGAPSMARRMIMHIKALYNFVLLDAPAMAEKYGIAGNPAGLLGRRRRGAFGPLAPSRPRQRVLSDAEIETWWRAIDRSNVLQARRLALKLVLVTAQRPGEIRRCRVDALRLEGPEPFWLLREEETKARRRHLVPLSSLAVDLFSKAIELGGGTYVFPSPEDRDEPLSGVALPTTQANFFRQHLSKLEPATPHDLRRSAATGMRRCGVAPML